MLLILSISILFLVAINFLLLIFSCNKINKKVKTDKKPLVLRPQIKVEEEEEQHLAPTGS